MRRFLFRSRVLLRPPTTHHPSRRATYPPAVAAAAVAPLRAGMKPPVGAPAAAVRRCVLPGSAQFAAAEQRQTTNVLSTTKYTSGLTFVLHALGSQARRLANVYFLCIAILQLATDLSPTSKYATILPLAGAILLSMLREALEDLRRHKVDWRINNRRARALRAEKFVDVRWRDLRVGDVIRVERGEAFPADLVPAANAGRHACR